MPHERQRTAGEHLHVLGQRYLREVHQTLPGALISRIDGLVPGVGSEVVDVPRHVQHGVPQRVVLRGPVPCATMTVRSGCVRAMCSTIGNTVVIPAPALASSSGPSDGSTTKSPAGALTSSRSPSMMLSCR